MSRPVVSVLGELECLVTFSPRAQRWLHVYSTSHPTFSSLDDDSVATLVHVCVTSRVDYCGNLLIGSLKKTTKKLQRVLNSAARIVSKTRKFDRGLAHFRRSELHWLDVVDRVRFRVYVQVFRCLHNISVHSVPTPLQRCCSPQSAIN